MKFNWFSTRDGLYVVTCIAGKPELVTKCSAGMTANLTPLIPKCELVCTRAAVAADQEDVTKYFECLYNSVTRTWVSTHQSCFKNWKFDEKLKTCVPAVPCTNGANNPPKCDACSGNKAFADGSCVDCGEKALDPETKTCKACPANSAYDPDFKKCVCSTAGEAINTALDPPECKTCAETSTKKIDETTKECKCNQGGTNPFDTPACAFCPEGQGLKGEACEPCPPGTAHDKDKHNCKCGNGAEDPFTECKTCPGSQTIKGGVCAD